jgi:hypothetical protein
VIDNKRLTRCASHFHQQIWCRLRRRYRPGVDTTTTKVDFAVVILAARPFVRSFARSLARLRPLVMVINDSR